MLSLISVGFVLMETNRKAKSGGVMLHLVYFKTWFESPGCQIIPSLPQRSDNSALSKELNVLVAVLYLKCYLVCSAYVCFFSGSTSSSLISWPDTQGAITLCTVERTLQIFFFPLSPLCSAFQVDVMVELRPLEDGAPLHRDVVLLLKCAKSVHWVIKAHSVIGKLDIVVSLEHVNR